MTIMINSDFALAVHLLLLLAKSDGVLLNSCQLSKLVNVHSVRIRKVLALMKNEGYIDAKEGLNGGFSISCDISRVSLKDIYLLTQDNLLKPKCHNCCKTCKVGVNIEEVLDTILSGAEQNFQKFLETETLKTVLEKCK